MLRSKDSIEATVVGEPGPQTVVKDFNDLERRFPEHASSLVSVESGVQ